MSNGEDDMGIKVMNSRRVGGLNMKCGDVCLLTEILLQSIYVVNESSKYYMV